MKKSCEYKTFYDTEFEATIAAARRSYDWDAEIIPYQCDNHYHITNADPSLRGQHVRDSRDYCDVCKAHMRPGRYPKHITLRGHIAAVQRARMGVKLRSRRSVKQVVDKDNQRNNKQQVDKPTTDVADKSK